MSVQYKKQRGSRINHRFMGMTTFENGWWYHESQKKWINHDTPYYESDGMGYNSHQRCTSVKAFIRKLKTAPIGVEFILVSRYVGFSVTGINKSKS
jgi:hypothetical protein